MRLTTLGTSCAQQTLTRTQSAHALSLSPSVVYLFDCGSSTSTQLLRSGIKATSIRKIFITHLHTDHVIGLPGLLTDILGGHGGKIADFEAGNRRENTNRRVVDVYGPQGIKEFVRTSFRLTYTMLASSFRIHELLSNDRAAAYMDEPFLGEDCSRDIVSMSGSWQDISMDDQCRVTAVSITHSVPSLGFIVKEDEKYAIPDAYITQLTQACGSAKDARYQDAVRRLKQGDSVALPETELPALSPELGREVIILGDTCDASAVLSHVTPPVSLILHESTNAYLPSLASSKDTLASVRERAIERGHSTPEMAGEFARLCQSDVLVLTHFSSRYSGADIPGAVKIMDGFESLARLAGSATQTAVEALFQQSAKERKRSKKSDGQYQGSVFAAWDGWTIDIPKSLKDAREP